MLKTLLTMVLVVGCGKFDEEGNGGEGTATNASEDAPLETINTKNFQTDLYSFNLVGEKINYVETDGAHNAPVLSKHWETATKASFFMRMPDGSLKDCERRVFIGIIKNYKGTGKRLGSLLFERADMSTSGFGPCNLYQQLNFKFEGNELKLFTDLKDF